MSIAYISGDFSTAVAISNPEFSPPFAGVNVNYLLRQRFMQDLASFAPLALNTAHPNFPDYKLVAEDEKMDISGLKTQWTRTYAKMPATYSQPGSIAYSLIGYFGSFGVNVTSISGRARHSKVLSARVQYDYFLLDPVAGKIFDANGVAVYIGAPGQLPSLTRVPIIQEQKYFAALLGAVLSQVETDYIAYTTQLVYPAPDNTSNQPPLEAYPTREVYESWVKRTATVKTYDPNTNALTDTGGYEIVAQASQCGRWIGNIVERQTVYVAPQ